MLSDHEMRMLRELERRLLDDDPEFPRRFDTRAQRLDRRHLGMPTAVAVVAAVFGGVLLLAGAPGPALALVTVTGLLGLIWRWWHASTSADNARDDHHST